MELRGEPRGGVTEGAGCLDLRWTGSSVRGYRDALTQYLTAMPINQLLWFAIPGGILIAAFIPFHWDLMRGNWQLIIASAPLVGYIINQSVRMCQEQFRSWEKPENRKVIQRIKDSLSWDRPFLVWELTIYGKGFPKQLLEHLRGMWLYLISFWTVIASASIGIIVLIVEAHLSSRPWTTGVSLLLIVYVFVILIFWRKKSLTYCTLVRQEEAIFKIYEKLFRETRNSLTFSR